MTTYKQEVKNTSREEIWKNAIYSLTVFRNTSRILREDRIREIWNYFLYDFKITKKNLNSLDSIDLNYINEWTQFSNSLYQDKTAADLRIVYLCGPEPENDLEIMLRYGVKIENIWAVESNNLMYTKALQNIKHKSFPKLKIFKGKLNHVLNLLKINFDIIYLDFTKSLLSKEAPLDTLHSIFDNNYLADLGILITNFPTPNEIKDEDVTTVADFFYDTMWIERRLNGENTNDFYSHVGNLISQDEFKQQIYENFDEAYSSFCTFYPMIYAANVSPIYNVINDDVARTQIFSDQNLSKYINNRPYITELSQLDTSIPYATSNDYFFINRLEQHLPKSRILSKYTTRANGKKFTYKEAITAGIQIRNNVELDCINIDTKKYFEIAYRNMKTWENHRLFCDGFFIHNLVELTINTLGQTYHPNLEKHRRFSYKAKTTKMNVDIFTFDRCLPFYLSIPSLPLLENATDLEDSELFLRIMLDIIGGKQSTFTPLNTYKASNTVGKDELFNIKFVESICERVFKS